MKLKLARELAGGFRVVAILTAILTAYDVWDLDATAQPSKDLLKINTDQVTRAGQAADVNCRPKRVLLPFGLRRKAISPGRMSS